MQWYPLTRMARLFRRLRAWHVAALGTLIGGVVLCGGMSFAATTYTGPEYSASLTDTWSMALSYLTSSGTIDSSATGLTAPITTSVAAETAVNFSPYLGLTVSVPSTVPPTSTYSLDASVSNSTAPSSTVYQFVVYQPTTSFANALTSSGTEVGWTGSAVGNFAQTVGAFSVSTPVVGLQYRLVFPSSTTLTAGTITGSVNLSGTLKVVQ